MILHLFNDEKVVNRSVLLFEQALPNRNIFICRICGEIRYVEKRDNIIFINDDLNYDNGILDDVDTIVIHMMDIWKIDFISKNIHRPTRIFWAVWGADMYNGLIAHWGYKIYYESWFLGLSYRLKSFIKYIAHISDLDFGYIHRTIRFLKRIDTILTTDEEYDIQKKYIGRYFSGTNLPVPESIYYSIEDILGSELIKKNVSGNKILVGNSASISGNHNYAFYYLSKININKRQIIVPLSYGNNNKYINHILNKGKNLFGTNFIPIMRFLPLNEYNDLLLECSVCVFANWRQEAVGNIVVALYLGAKVFLSKRSPLLLHYRNLGIFVYELENIDQDQLDTPLTEIEKSHNRNIIYKIFCRDNIIYNIIKVWN